MSTFISVKESLPRPKQRCYVFAETGSDKPGMMEKTVFQTMAEYIPPRTVLFEDYMDDDYCGDDWGDYDEENDCYWTREGWYEWQSETDVNYFLTAKVTHWMPLFELP